MVFLMLTAGQVLVSDWIAGSCCIHYWVVWENNNANPGLKVNRRTIFFFLAGRSDYRLTLVFRVKTQSRAMGNTADMYDSLRADVGFSEFDAKRKSYMISNMLTNSASFSTFKHSDPPDTVRGRSTLKDGVVSGRIYFDTGRSARGIE